jgi:uncharacterized protein (TIGR00251 family)
MEKPWTVSADGLIVTVRLTPKGGRDMIEGIDHLADGRAVLKARVRAAASDGEANEALARLLAKAVAVSPSQVVLIRGATSRLKRLQVIGDARSLAAALERIGEIASS